LKEKVDVTVFEELEGKIQKLKEGMNQRVEMLKERISENGTRVERSVANDGKCHSEVSYSDEQNGIDARRSNVIIYRAQEIDSESVDDRKSGGA